MSQLEQLEKELKQIKTKNESSLMNVIKDTMSLWLSEFSKTVSQVFGAPKSGKNQISKWIEDWENQVINGRTFNW